MVFVAPVLNPAGWLRPFKFFFHSPLGGTITRIALKRFADTAFVERFLSGSKLPTEPYRTLYLEQPTFKGTARSYLSMARSDMFNDYTTCYRAAAATGKPLLVIRGAQDRVVKPETVEKIAEIVARTKVVTLENAGHMAATQVTEEFNRTILEFLSGR